ncbi:hypothetical protein EGM_03227 [Macaca fascicularis]|uniref:Uncharacterized protein n=1 Tax=Macaca fascicularis TaxID=9541 RepID=G7PIA1_MACFA|nr:hypothetical protein EGM_03227 [Macaca fascicularis]
MGGTSAVSESTTISSSAGPSTRRQKNRRPQESCRSGGLFLLSREAQGMLWRDFTCHHFQVNRTTALMVFKLCWKKVSVISLVLPVCASLTVYGGC